VARLKVSQKADEFFELFTSQADLLVEATRAMSDLVNDFTEIDLKSGRIADLEHEGDEITHGIVKRLNTTFVTPMDREDIYDLASAMDDVLDTLDSVAGMFVLHKISSPLPSMVQQASILSKAAEETRAALAGFKDMARDTLEPHWIEINRLENEGDQIYRQAVADLFSGDHKAMDVLKWKDVIEGLEEAMDGLENVANVVESAVLKHA
jgi:predicted phosphate transport protein (TIGR00153 family)